ncbi:cellulose biosynthesis protein BcsF [Sodalis sp. RH19]|uniref:cellulose biosynthesis protein BcsF n=1 Tax=unclassified Sodalis (in: enterobacteria) TaxID=2636512 RepID=UPI0039B64A8F
MNIVDILQMFCLAAVIFIPLGFMAHKYLPLWRNRFNAWFLSPRYLRPIRASHVKTHLAMKINHRSTADKPAHDE